MSETNPDFLEDGIPSNNAGRVLAFKSKLTRMWNEQAVICFCLGCFTADL